MGTDTPIAVLSSRPRMIFDYFAQLFAQVTNPPLDAIREEIVTSLSSIIGPEGNLLEPDAGHCRQVVLPFPVIDNDELSKVLHINDDGHFSGFAGVRISGLYPVAGGGDALERRLNEIFHEVDAVIRQGKRFIVLSDRDSDAQLAPIPSLLLCAAVHHHLVRTKTRTMVGLLVEAGDVREVHHVALLIGYGAAAVNPYLALESRGGPGPPRRHHGRHAREGHAQHRQGARQGRAQGHVEDGRLHGGLVPRRPDLRGGRPLAGRDRRLLHRHRVQARRRRPRRHRRGGGHAPPRGLPAVGHRARRTAP